MPPTPTLANQLENQLQHNIPISEVIVADEVKRCSRCGIGFPATREFFYADARLHDGLYCHCKSCQLLASNNDDTRISYYAMIRRCYNPKVANYRWYGAKGIQVCERWRNSYQDFLADVGPRPSKQYTLGRTGDVGNYDPGNVSWIPWADQHRTRVENRRANMPPGYRYPCGRRKVPLSRQQAEAVHAL